MGGEGERKNCGGGPAKQQRDRMREQRPGPAEVAPYVPVAMQLGVRLGGECTGEEDSEQQQDYPANLAGERRARGLIVPVPVRAW